MGLSFDAARLTNGDLAGDGLTNYPNAIGVLWDVESEEIAIWCRNCLEGNQDVFAQLPATEWGYVLAAGRFVCANCNRNINRDHPRPPRQGEGAGPPPQKPSSVA